MTRGRPDHLHQNPGWGQLVQNRQGGCDALRAVNCGSEEREKPSRAGLEAEAGLKDPRWPPRPGLCRSGRPRAGEFRTLERSVGKPGDLCPEAIRALGAADTFSFSWHTPLPPPPGPGRGIPQSAPPRVWMLGSAGAVWDTQCWSSPSVDTVPNRNLDPPVLPPRTGWGSRTTTSLLYVQQGRAPPHPPPSCQPSAGTGNDCSPGPCRPPGCPGCWTCWGRAQDGFPRDGSPALLPPPTRVPAARSPGRARVRCPLGSSARI